MKDQSSLTAVIAAYNLKEIIKIYGAEMWCK